MKRRGAIAGMTAAVTGLTSVLQARGWAPQTPWRIAFLVSGSMPAAGSSSSVQEVIESLRQRGYEPDRHFVTEISYADGAIERLPELAARLLMWKPDVIVALLSPAAHAARRVTDSVPIVMAGAGDPVGSGLVRSLAQPGGNVTGLAALGPELAGKTLALLRELKPALRRVAALAHDSDPFTATLMQGLERGAAALSLQLDTRRVSAPSQYGAAFESWRQWRAEALFVQPSLEQKPAIDLAMRHGLPSCSFVRAFVEQGGLLAYAPSLREIGRQTAGYVERILRGARPADLPVQQVAGFDLLINRRAARALGVTVPAPMLLRASEVIE